MIVNCSVMMNDFLTSFTNLSIYTTYCFSRQQTVTLSIIQAFLAF